MTQCSETFNWFVALKLLDAIGPSWDLVLIGSRVMMVSLLKLLGAADVSKSCYDCDKMHAADEIGFCVSLLHPWL